MTEYRLNTPLTEEEIRRVRVRDIIYLTGELYTIRDMAYERAVKTIREGGSLPFNLKDRAIWHCGPILREEEGEWRPISLGSTTSSRFTSQAAQLVEECGVKLIVGKGFMGNEVLKAFRNRGAAYALTTGGAAAYYAEKVRRVIDVYWRDLGMPSAVWVLEVEELGPLIVGMDSYGGDMFAEAARRVDVSIRRVYRKLGIDPEHRYTWWP
ncbi:MAG: FumA C-terminus/TtdB family hydratase beta subunit [Candidatus Bathyarchaeia archaeon]